RPRLLRGGALPARDRVGRARRRVGAARRVPGAGWLRRRGAVRGGGDGEARAAAPPPPAPALGPRRADPGPAPPPRGRGGPLVALRAVDQIQQRRALEVAPQVLREQRAAVLVVARDEARDV